MRRFLRWFFYFFGVFFIFKYINFNPYLGLPKVNNFVDYFVGTPDLILIFLFCKNLLPSICKFNWFWILLLIFLIQGFSIFGLLLLIRIVCIFWLIRERKLSYHLTIFLVIYSLFDHLLITSSIPFLVIFWLLNFGKIKFLDRAMIGLLSFNIFLAIFQVLAQKSLGLSIFGEPILSQNLTQIAKQEFGELRIIKGYGFFQHPNIMGCVGIILLFWSENLSKFIKIIGLILAFLSFSRLAFFGLAFWIFIRLGQFKWLFGISFLIFIIIWFSLRVPADVGRWIDLSNFWQLVSAFGPIELLFGVGNYPREISKLTDQVWQWQPVHNILFLFLTEFGLFGTLTAIFAIKSVPKLDKK